MDELNILNVLGQNSEAQEALREILSSKYPTIETEFNLSDQIIDKYFDWSFNFEYTADGGGLKRWKTVINSYCGKHPKLTVLQQYFAANDTNATLEEVYSGEDVTDFTDNRESTAETGFNAVGNNSTTTGLSNEVKSKFTDGKNTTKNVFKHGQKRTYADGRTWQEILTDTETMQAPIYKFINGWANVLVNPCECLNVVECLPTVSATAKADKGKNASVTVKNTGTPYNARFDFDFVLPKGDKGASFYYCLDNNEFSTTISDIQPWKFTPIVTEDVEEGYCITAIGYLCRFAKQYDGGDWTSDYYLEFIKDLNGLQGEQGPQGPKGDKGDKGAPGIGTATLSNEDGNSTENGFTQSAVKGVAQAKNYYNLGAYDTYVPNGDGTATITRKTQYNDNGTQSLLGAAYQYTETVIENQPLITLDQNGSQWVREEWGKGLNLADFNHLTDNGGISLEHCEVGKTYTFSTTLDLSRIVQIKISTMPGGFNYVSVTNSQILTFTMTAELVGKEIFILEPDTYNNVTPEANYDYMLNEGLHAYPYQPYEGKIVREKDLSGIQLFPEGVNPNETVGGVWNDLGAVTVGSTTLHAYQKIS